MSEINDGGPAFPNAHFNDVFGMTLRDHFAGLAMQGWLSTFPEDMAIQHVHVEGIAGLSYRMADAMLKAREA